MDDRNTPLRLVATLAAIGIGIILFWYVGIPIIAFILSVLLGISGFFATIFKYVLFILLCVATLFGLLLLASWIIHEFVD